MFVSEDRHHATRMGDHFSKTVQRKRISFGGNIVSLGSGRDLDLGPCSSFSFRAGISFWPQ